jgi:hypothetical protein
MRLRREDSIRSLSCRKLVLAASRRCPCGRPPGPTRAHLAACAGFEARTQGNCNAAEHLGGVEWRIVEKGAQGVDALRDGIWITRGIHNRVMTETVTWLDRQRTAHAACLDLASAAKGR